MSVLRLQINTNAHIESLEDERERRSRALGYMVLEQLRLGAKNYSDIEFDDNGSAYAIIDAAVVEVSAMEFWSFTTLVNGVYHNSGGSLEDLSIKDVVSEISATIKRVLEGVSE